MFDYESERDTRLFFRTSYFDESRANGTPQQTNRTRLGQWSAGGDWSRARLGNFSVRAYGGKQVYDQNFSAVAPDRNSETLTRVQRVPSQFAGLSAQWTRSFASRHTLVAGIDAREVRGASDEIAFAGGRAASLVGAGGRERSGGVFVEEIAQLTTRLTLAGGVRFDRWRNYRAQNATRRALSIQTRRQTRRRLLIEPRRPSARRRLCSTSRVRISRSSPPSIAPFAGRRSTSCTGVSVSVMP
jgi:outer membrane receptor protein involved in Fe transport